MRLAFHNGGVYVPPNPARIGVSGLGLDQETNQIASMAISGAATTGAILTGLAHMGMISAAFGPAAPIAAAIAGIATIGIAIANQFHGCGTTCTQATDIANKVEVYLRNNVDTYMSASPHYKSLQDAALNNFDLAARAMKQACGDPALGAAGQRCISERLVPGGTAPWCPNPGNTGCDWYVLYRDPIANDPNVVPDPTGTAGEQTMIDPATGQRVSIPSPGGVFPMPLVIGGAALVAFLMMSGGGNN